MYRLQKKAQDGFAAPARAAGRTGSLLDHLADDDAVLEETVLKPHLEPRRSDAQKPRTQPVIAGAEPVAPDNERWFSTYFPGAADLGAIGIDEMAFWLRRGKATVALAVLFCLALALGYAVLTPPRYTAYTDIVVNPFNLNVVNDGVQSASPQRDTLILEVESKLRTLTSRNVLTAVVDELRLERDGEFTRGPPLARLRALFVAPARDDLKVGALRALDERVKAQRDPRSFVVTLSVWSDDPQKSVTIAQAVMRAFEKELFQSGSDSSRRAADALNARLSELRRNVTEAERRVEDFRRDNGLQQINGELASRRLSGELDSQVLAAQQRLIQEEARVEQMQAAIAQNRTVNATIFDSPTMNIIREQYSLLTQQIGAMTETYGARHPRLSAGAAERASLERGMAAEAQRIMQAARAAMAQARASLDALRQKAAAGRATVFTNNDEEVRLRDLERDARSAAAIYETYLTRSRQIAEQQAIDSTNVRVISPPVAPNFKSWPPGKPILLLFGALAGLLLGAGLAVTAGFWRFLRFGRGGAIRAAG